MDEFARAAFREREARQVVRRRAFLVHLSVYVATNVFLFVIWALVGGGFPWFLIVVFGWGIGVVAHGASAYLMSDPTDIVLEREQQRLKASERDKPTS
ncbi:MAG: hypothetical protein QOJ67_3383 [Acidimicrobiaceae bacterium]|jgi:hypothetical protein